MIIRHLNKNKLFFWLEFEEIAVPHGKKWYKCKYCNSEWAKNTTRLQQYLSSCSAKKIVLESTNSEPEPTTKQSNKRKQYVLDNYMFSFTKEDQNELKSLLVRAFCSIGIPLM